MLNLLTLVPFLTLASDTALARGQFQHCDAVKPQKQAGDCHRCPSDPRIYGDDALAFVQLQTSVKGRRSGEVLRDHENTKLPFWKILLGLVASVSAAIPAPRDVPDMIASVDPASSADYDAIKSYYHIDQDEILSLTLDGMHKAGIGESVTNLKERSSDGPIDGIYIEWNTFTANTPGQFPAGFSEPAGVDDDRPQARFALNKYGDMARNRMERSECYIKEMMEATTIHEITHARQARDGLLNHLGNIKLDDAARRDHLLLFMFELEAHAAQGQAYASGCHDSHGHDKYAMLWHSTGETWNKDYMLAVGNSMAADHGKSKYFNGDVKAYLQSKKRTKVAGQWKRVPRMEILVEFMFAPASDSSRNGGFETFRNGYTSFRANRQSNP